MTYDEWSGKDYKIPLSDFLRVVHGAERVRVEVIVTDEWREGKGMPQSFVLTEDAFRLSEDEPYDREFERLLEYYANVPVWNTSAGLDCLTDYGRINGSGSKYAACITVHCNYSDVRDALAREKQDIRREKRRQWRVEQKRNGKEY